MELVGANRAGLFLHLMPVFGSIMAIAFLGESLRWFHGAGIALIASGAGALILSDHLSWTTVYWSMAALGGSSV